MASVTYQIKGKYDNKAVKSAQSDLTSLGKSMKSIGVAVWAKVGAEAIKGLNTVINGATENFMKQNEAAAKLNATIKASGKDFSKLAEMQDKLSKGNFFDGDTLNNAQALAINMGLTQEKVIDVMSAAEDLAATGIMPLDQAVKALSQSYSGNVATLGKVIPELKDLTKEELANGDAVSIIAEKYKGMSDAMVNTFSGRNQQFKNNFSDLQASIGGIIESFKFLGQGSMMQPLNNITKWITDNRNSIINFFLHLPEVAQASFRLIKDVLKKTFENLPEWFSTIGVNFVAMWKDKMLMVFNIAKEAFKGLGELLDFAIGNPFRKSKDFINEMLNNLIEGINNLPQHLPKWVKNFLGIDENTEMIKFRFKVGSSDNNKTWNDTAKKIEEAMSNASKELKDGSKKIKEDWGKVLDSTKDFYKDEFKTLKDNMESILGQDLPKELEQAFEQAAISFASTGGSIVSGNDEGSGEGTEQGFLASLYTSFSEMDWLGELQSFFFGLENVTKLLSPWQTILKSMFEVLAPVINDILAPLVGALKIIGQTLGYTLAPLLQVLSPVIQKLGEAFVWLYNNVIVNVANNLIGLFTMFRNAVISIINGIIKLINNIPGVDVALMEKVNASALQLSTISYDSLTTAGTASSTTTSGSGSSASYTAARDIYVTINFDHSFVTGDATEIAVMLKNEIAHAEQLGY